MVGVLFLLHAWERKQNQLDFSETGQISARCSIFPSRQMAIINERLEHSQTKKKEVAEYGEIKTLLCFVHLRKCDFSLVLCFTVLG